MDDTATDLRVTSDALVRDLEVLGELEDEKRTLEPGDPRLVELAQRVEDIARRVLSATVRQRHLTQVGHRQVEEGHAAAPETSIDDTVRPIADILSEWRAAERRAGAADPESAEAAEANALADHYREEYRRALAQRDSSG
jgi:DNA-binding HxlR family transcriptional regulator